MLQEQNKYLFLKSAFLKKNIFQESGAVIKWLSTLNDNVRVDVQKTDFNSLKQWSYNKDTKNIRHDSGKFFSIDGIHVETNWGIVKSWQQPIINQPEIGYLGIITKEFNGVLYFLLQAKIEPGNINLVQLSPTLQATRSNYQQVHGGNKPLYLEYFQKATQEQILLDQLQSEQGARFLRKRNRNIIIKIEEEVPVYNNFVWLTLGEIKSLMEVDNLVNMDTRTVISGITFGDYDNTTVELMNVLNEEKIETLSYKFLKSALLYGESLHSTKEIITFITQLKSNYDLFVSRKDLKKLDNWRYTDSEIHHIDNKYFKVIAVDVTIENREVINWSQPMVEPAQEGLCAFVCKEINGLIHFAVQAKLECGNYDTIELAPTVQCLTGNYKKTDKGKLPFLDYVLNVLPENIIFDTKQSEEGGRFYKEQNRNMIVMADDTISEELPEKYIWMSLNQMYEFIKFNNYLNIQARSLISAIQFVD